MKLRTISVIALICLTISSCNLPTSFEKYSDYVDVIDAYEQIEGNGYYKPSNFSNYEFIDENGDINSFVSFLDVSRHKDYRLVAPSTGKINLLVIPVDFADYEATSLSGGADYARANIQNAFFGDTSKNQFYSVAEFYNRSSYGKLVIDGFVSDWYRSSYLASSIKDVYNRASVVRNIYNSALAWYEEKYGDLEQFYIEGDANKGIPVYLIYSHPIDDSDTAGEKTFWAYTINQSKALFSWSSYSLLNPTLFNKVDAHTYIHEVGHLLGLLDYYNTDDGQYNPLGQADMMDCSLGDHTGLSKMLLNWTRPYVITDSTTITIRPFVVSGDLILLKDNWNNTPMDEYLLLEFYSPTSLNTVDSRRNSSVSLMKEIGIKVYHVDARLGYISNNTMHAFAYVKDGSYPKNEYKIYLAHDNTYSLENMYGTISLYQLLEKSGENSFMNGGVATDETLFHAGDAFGINTFENFTFNDGSELGYTFKIDSLTNTAATITFTRL